jgi:mono/diheme cytochrome c family protein
MKRLLRWFGVLALAFGALVAAGLAYLFTAYPKAGPVPVVEVERTPERLERGTYLAEHVALCVDCHGERDFGRYSGPVKPGTFGKGGERFGPELGLPGTVVIPNITPFAIGHWSDGELLRTLTTGATPDGRALFPLMPWQAYAQLCDEDLAALITYVRNLAPIEATHPRTSLDFPVNLIVRTLPTPRVPVKACPDPKDTVAYGEYLVRTASCQDCHTPRNDKGEFEPELAFAGDVPLPLPNGTTVRSANLTPDVATGIGSWTKEQFVARFARFRDGSLAGEVDKDAPNTLMPWTLYAGMTDEDLGAIYDYLRTQKPIERARTPRLAAR